MPFSGVINNQLTRAERSRLDNTIDNALFKIDRYLPRAPTDVAERGAGSRTRCARAFATAANNWNGETARPAAPI